MIKEQTLQLISAYAEHVGRAEATIAKRAGAYARLPQRLATGKGCNIDTLISVKSWLSQNWPADLEWPREIDRPRVERRKKETHS